MISRVLKKIQNLWSKEWVLKLISLCLAVLLWYFVGGKDDVEKNIMIPVEVINLPNDLIISNKYKKQLEVTVRGPRSAILQMDEEQDPRQIDLSKASAGTKVEQMTPESIPVSRGVDVLRVQPSSIILSLDNLIQKELPINPVTTGNVAPGYVLTDMTIDPKTITIHGPETILSRVEVLKTTPINLQGLMEPVQLQIPLELDSKIVDLIGETSVTVDLSITYETVTKDVSKVKVESVIYGKARKIKPETVSVKLKVPTLALKDGVKVTDLFSVKAVKPADAVELRRRKVEIVPAEGLDVPLEILSIEPSYVTLIEALQHNERRPQDMNPVPVE